MIKLKKYQCFIGLSSVIFPFMVGAIDAKTDNQSKIIQSTSDKLQPVAGPQSAKRPVNYIAYLPPKSTSKGQPNIRVSHGGTRGEGDDLPTITLLTPNQNSILTARPQTTLYWHLSKGTAEKITVTITADDEVEPLLEHIVQKSNSGIHNLKLAGFNIMLQPDKEYEWSVCAHEKNQPCTQIAKSLIQFSANFVINNKGNPMENAKIFASNGIWYDALEELMEASLKTEARELLNQVGLSFSK
jgi:hypothetical protein